MRYRDFIIGRDLLPLLTETYLSQGEQLVVGARPLGLPPSSPVARR